MSEAKGQTGAKSTSKIKKSIILYPLLFGLYPFINTYSSNINIIYDPRDLIVPAIVTLVVTAAVWAVLSFLWKNAAKAALLTLVMEMLFFSYGHIYELLKLDEHNISDGVLLGVWAAILIVAIVLIFRYGKNIGAATGTLNIMAGALLVIPILSIVLFTLNGRQNVAHGSAQAYEISEEAHGYDDQLPDIYYIILDGYPRTDVLEAMYDYDNSAFMDKLASLDFYVAPESHANYLFTSESVSSSLNFDYLQKLLPDIDPNSKDLTPLYGLLQDNSLCRTLREIGYYYVIYDSSWEPTSHSPCADTVRSLHETSELDSLLLQTTLLRPFVISDIASDLRAQRRFIFDDLPEVAKLNEPTLTFAHIILPHYPILFDRDGGIPADPPQGVRLWAGTGLTPEAKQYYLDQVYFTTQQIEITLQGILANSDVPPIIVLQSDHGPDPDVDWGLEERFLRERMPNLNAYHLPYGGQSAVYPSITPVNTFRVILNYYFSAGLPLLEDRTWYSNWYTGDYYNFVEVTLQPIYRGENITIARSWDDTHYAIQSGDETLVSFEASSLDGEALSLESESGWRVELTPDADSPQVYDVQVENADGEPIDSGTIDLRTDDMERLGMSQDVYHAFLDHRASMTSPEVDAVLFNPAPDPAVLRRDSGRVGRLITTIPDVLGEETIDSYYNLLAWMDATRYESELDLTPDEDESITAWRNSYLPGYLKDAGIEYLVFDDVWWSYVTDDLVPIIENTDYYEPVDNWLVYYRYGEGSFYPDTIGYHVYRVVGDAR